MKKILSSLLLLLILFVLVPSYLYAAGEVTLSSGQLSKTNQQICFNGAGMLISCGNSGQDGELQTGLVWPLPRFITNADATVTDNLTGLVWPRDAGTPDILDNSNNVLCTGGPKNWQQALDYVACLNLNNYLGYSDWRLPNAKEQSGLVDISQFNPPLALGHPFLNPAGAWFWTSTTDAFFTTNAYAIEFYDGSILSFDKTTHTKMVWPVRDGTAGVVSTARSGQTTGYDANSPQRDDGALQTGLLWPSPRFTDNGDLTYTDQLTGLIWPADRGTPSIDSTVSCSGGIMSWQQAFDYVACLNLYNYLGFSDWRLPNKNEIVSLVNYGVTSISSWLDSEGFYSSDVFAHLYWSSSTGESAPDSAWFANLENTTSSGAMEGVIGKANSLYVWPVRSGQLEIFGTSDLEITGSPVPSGPVAGGASITYTITVKNLGPDLAHSVYADADIASLGSFVSAVPSQGRCADVDGDVRCGFGNVPSGGQASVDITLVLPNSPGPKALRTTATHSGTDPVLTNNLMTIQTLVTGLVAWYPFDGNAADASGNGHYGGVAGPVPAPDRFNGTNSAFFFASELDGFVTVPSAPDLDLQNVTLEAWIMPLPQNNTYPVIVIRNDDSCSGFIQPYTLYLNGPNGKFGFQVGNISGAIMPVYSNQDFSSYINRWVHIAGTYDGQFLRIYINGVLDNTVYIGYLDLAESINTLQIGNSCNGAYSNAFNGLIDEVRIYNYALNSLGVLSDMYETILPRTGQQNCYSTEGAVVNCDLNRGQDGYIQAGIPWPVWRFTDYFDVAMKDNLTGLIWSKDGSTPEFIGAISTCTGGLKDWQGALDYVRCLNENNYLEHNDWRLPNINELFSTLNYQYGEQARWLNNQGLNVAGDYWSSTTKPTDGAMAYLLRLWGGTVIAETKSVQMNVWPVRGVSGADSTVTIPETGQLVSYDANTPQSDDGALQMGLVWPADRLELIYANTSGPCAVQTSDCDADNTNDLVFDQLTGLTWAGNANIIAGRDQAPGNDGPYIDNDDYPQDGYVTWQHALDFVSQLNTENYLGYNDWRMPNIREMFSLIDFGQGSVPMLPSGHPFINIDMGTYRYWDSTTATFQDDVHGVRIDEGTMPGTIKNAFFPVWPVRGGHVEPFGTADVGITYAITPAVVDAGAEAMFTMTVTNNSTTDVARSVIISNEMPEGSVARFTTSAFPVLVCSVPSGLGNCSLGNMAPGETIIYDIHADLFMPGIFNNTASVFTSGNDPMPSNNLSSASVTVNPAPCASAATGLVSQWSAEGTADDSLGVNNGTLMNDAAYGWGKVGRAFSLDGVDDYVQIPASTSLDITTGDFTIGVWIMPSVIGDVGSGIIGRTAGDNRSGWGLAVQGSAYGTPGKLNFFYGHSDGGTWSGQSTDTILTGEWTHVVVARSGIYLTYYINGNPSGTFLQTGNFDNSMNLAIGDIYTPSTGYNQFKFNGFIDEVQVYNRELVATEIQAIYNAQSAERCFDSVWPSVVLTSPSNGATDVPVNTAITATFSEFINPATINSYTFIVDGVTASSISYDPSAKTATFVPSVSLTPGTTYSVTVVGGPFGVKDLTDNNLGGDYTWSFTAESSRTFSGAVNDSSGNPVIGAIISQVGNFDVSTASGDDGTFVLGGLPLVPFSVVITDGLHVPVYSKNFQPDGNVTVLRPYIMHTESQLSGWFNGPEALYNLPTKTLIKGTVINTQNPSESVGLAVVTCTSAYHQGPTCPYPITYSDGTNFGGIATHSNGHYYIYNVDPGDVVTVSAAKPGWNFGQAVFETHSDGISEGGIGGSPVVTGTGQINGTVFYSGSMPGQVYVGLFDSHFPITPGIPNSIKVASPGPDGSYTINGVPDGTYYLGAIKTENILNISKTDPWGVYPSSSSPAIVTISGGNVFSGADITLADGSDAAPNPFYHERNILPSLLGSWGFSQIRHNNDGSWGSVGGKVTYYADGTGVELNTGSLQLFTYSAISNADGSITVTSYYPRNGNAVMTRRNVISDDGSMMLRDGTYAPDAPNSQFYRVFVKMGPERSYTGGELGGDYHVIGYEHNGVYEAPPGGNGSNMAASQISRFNGEGLETYYGKANSDGTIWEDSGSSNYTPDNNGFFLIGEDGIGVTSSSGGLIAVLSFAPNKWADYFAMTKGDRTYATSDLAGKWAFVSFGDWNGSSFYSSIGTAVCDSAGSCYIQSKDLRSDGSTDFSSETVGPMSIAPDGSFGASLLSGTPTVDFSGAIGNNGNTLIRNNSFYSAYPNDREITVAIRCETCGNLSGTYGTCNWKNAVDGNWNDATKWDCNHVPGEMDNAFITKLGAYTVTLDAADAAVNSLTLGGSGSTPTLLVSGRTLSIGSNSSIATNAVMTISSSIISGTGGLINSGTLNTANSTINVTMDNRGTLNAYTNNSINGELLMPLGSVLHIEGNGQYGGSGLTVANGFTNNGLIELTDIDWHYGASLTVTNGTLINALGAEIRTLGAFAVKSLYLQLDNRGTVNLNHTTSLNYVNAVHLNSGVINVNSGASLSNQTSFTNTGTIAIASGQTLTVYGGTFTNGIGGTLKGNGTAFFNSTSLQNEGSIAPGASAGQFTISGDLHDYASAGLNIEIGGYTAGTEFDVLAVSGTAVLGGTLNVSLISGFIPQIGDSFEIVTSSSGCSGTFSTVNLPVLPAGRWWNIAYNSANITLSVVQVTSFNATNEFSSTNGNPNGVWSYGWMPTNFSQFNLYTNHASDANSLFWYGWNGDWTPSVWKKLSAGTPAYVPQGWLSMHPGPGTEPSVMRWTAPYAGYVHVAGQFLAGDDGSMQVAVRLKNQPWWQAANLGTFDLNTPVAIGDTIDFAVYGGYSFGNTPVEATITYINAPCTPVTAGLVSQWSAENNANDTMGVNNGSLQNGATFAAGKVGQALSFDGIDDYTGVPNSVSLNITGDITVGVWIRTTDKSTAKIIIGKYQSSIDRGWLIGMLASGQAVFDGRDGSGAYFGSGGSATDIADGNWHYVTGMRQGNIWKIYIDGVFQNSQSGGSGGSLSSTIALGIGANTENLGMPYYFNGLIDEAHIFNRALTQSEIEAIYNAHSTGACQDTSAPTVVSTSPISGATGVPVSSVITATFSDFMDEATITTSTFSLQPSVSGTVAYNHATKTATFTPSSNLSNGTTYTAMITAGAGDLAGNHLAGAPVTGNHTWSFETVPVEMVSLSLSSTGTGSGTVILDPPGTDCGTNCRSYPYGTHVTLTPQPAPSSFFDIWVELDCQGGTVTMDGPKTCTAQFTTCTSAPSGLIAWWQGEGNAKDSVGMNNGAMVGGSANIALGKPVTANYSPGFGAPSLITDGTSAPEGTVWTNSTYGVRLDGTLTVDLGQLYSGINRVIVQADDNDTYRVEYSTDNTVWMTLYNVPLSGGAGLRTRDSGILSPVNARYIRLYPTSGDGMYSASELQIFGPAAGYAAGKVGQAFSFDGVNDFVSLPDGIVPSTARNFTVSAWSYPNNISIDQRIFSGGANGGEYTLFVSNNNYIFGVKLSNGNWYTVAAPATVGQWALITGVRSGTVLQLFVNGALIDSITIPDLALYVESGFFSSIGAYNWVGGPNAFFNGLIDEIQIYNSALSSAEIQALYNAGSSGACSIPNIGVTPSSKDFGDVAVNSTSAVQTFTFTNTGSADLHVTGGQLLGPDAGMFTVTQPSAGACPLTSFTAPAGGSCSLNVTFTPASTGSMGATFRVITDDPDTPNLDIPLSGNGIKATATVELSNLSYTYDGTQKQATVTTNPSGLSVVVTYDGSATLPVNAGSYEVSAVINDPNYQGSANGTLVISPISITVTADAKTKVYGGADPELTYTITSGSLVTGDSFTGALARAAGENVGAYGINQGNLALSGNYSLGYVVANLTITPRPITATAEAKTKVYGGADPALTYQITSGSLAGGDSFGGALARVAGENVGAYAITQGSLALNANYNLTYVGANLTITKAGQTIGAINFGSTSVSVGNTTTASAIATSGLAVTFTSQTPAICTVSGSTVTGVAAGTCTIAANQAGDGNYNAAPQVTGSIQIKSTYTYTVNKYGSGTITSKPAGFTCVPESCTGEFPITQKVVLSFKPDKGKKVLSVYVNGVNMGAIKSLTLRNLKKPPVIVVTFSL